MHHASLYIYTRGPFWNQQRIPAGGRLQKFICFRNLSSQYLFSHSIIICFQSEYSLEGTYGISSEVIFDK